ncbi:MAG: erythromycin esterase family protein [Bdellovibrionales bacterium]|nr:erythromycin esterase family protein [Bdellovibrionales bacterium]
MTQFKNRKEAGLALAERLNSFKKDHPLILAIPRGGVPVAFEVAQGLETDLDLLMVKKIGTPDYPEVAIGAVSEDGRPRYDESLMKRLGILKSSLKPLVEKKKEELREQIREFRGMKSAVSVEGRTVIIVDDGIATGTTLKAAMDLLLLRKPKKIIVATPVAPKETVKELSKIADELICLLTPSPFYAVSDYYSDFKQVANEEVKKLIQSASQEQEEPFYREMVFRDGDAELKADLQLVEEMKGVVVFAHGSGSSRQSPRNKYVAQELNKAGYGTLLADLLTEKEASDRKNVFDIDLLVQRVLKATDTMMPYLPSFDVPIAYFGASTGAAAALGATAKSPREIFAVISRGGRPDLARTYLSQVKAPTLLIVGAEDSQVIPLNQSAAERLKNVKLVLVPRATHLFEEPGTLEEVVEYSLDWLEQFSPQPKVTLNPVEGVVREIQSLAQPIKSEGAWNNLIQQIAKAKVVMLGEATHGSAEFYSVRRMISEKLIRDHGFDFIAVEGDWPDCQKLNEYIRTGAGGSAQNIMRQFHRWPTWMWANNETASLIEWMQSFQAGFFGLDVYSLFESMDYVKAYAQQNLEPALAEAIQKRYAGFDPFERNEKAYAQFLLKFPEGFRGEVIQNLRELLRVRLADVGEGNLGLFSAQQNARIVKNAEEYYRSMVFGGADSWNVRDQHMIETLDLLLHRGPQPRKAIVWAHNSHIGDYHATSMLEEGYVNLGGLAREKFGQDQVALVGFGSYQGEVLASPAWDSPETVTSLPEARESSFEFYCHKASKTINSQRFYMTFDSAARNSILGKRRYGHRAVGVVYEPRFENHGRNYVPSVMAQRYDAFVYIDRTSALRSIPTIKTTQELPETWPGGV